jgi:hypothetical protein
MRALLSGLRALAVALALLPAATATADARLVSLLANDLAWDPVRGQVWASVPSHGGPFANGIVAIDPVTGALGASLFVGSEPTRLTISHDGEKLWVWLAGSRRVVRVDLDALAVDLDFTIGGTQLDPGIAVGFAAHPTDASRLAIAESDGPLTRELAIYAEGVLEASLILPVAPSVLAFDPTGETLYGIDPGFGLISSYDVDSSSLTQLAELHTFTRDALSLVLAGGRLHTSNGFVFDATTLARAPVDGPHPARGVSSAGGELAYLTPNAVALHASATLQPIGAVAVPFALGSRSAPDPEGGFVATGARRWAFRTNAGQVFLVEASPDVADADADGIGDGIDNCRALANPSQANDDGDFLGNACDADPVFAFDVPRHAALCTTGLQNELLLTDSLQGAVATAQSLLAIVEAELAECENGTDADADGQVNRVDQCTDTPLATPVDDSGCSQAQLCALVRANQGYCKQVDWRNDEPTKKSPKDCKLVASQCRPR